jgi:hypothetical protein
MHSKQHTAHTHAYLDFTHTTADLAVDLSPKKGKLLHF